MALIPSQVILQLAAMLDVGQSDAIPLSCQVGDDHAQSPGITSVVTLMLPSGDWSFGVLPFLVSAVHLCPLSNLLRDHFNMSVDQPTKPIPLRSPVVQSPLVFWSQQDLVSQGVSLQRPAPTHILTTDTSNYRWGGGGSVPNIITWALLESLLAPM